MRWDIVALGEPLYELNQQPGGRFLPGFGGDTSNVVIAAARLGARTAYISRLGMDVFGDAIADLWQAEGVDARAVVRDSEAPTGRYFVTHGPEGHEFTYKRQGSAASRMTPADVPESLIAAASFLHVSGISLAISSTARATVEHAVALAKAHGVRVSFDTNFRPRLWTVEDARPVIEAIAVQADLLKTSLDEAVALTGLTTAEAVAQHYLSRGVKAVVVTLGNNGVLIAAEGRVALYPAFPAAAVDATGAGDAFTGALLTELCRGIAIHDAARFAAAAAALSTEGYGAIAPLPHRAEVEALLKQTA